MTMSDKEIHQLTGITRREHEDRNELNEAPKGLIKPSPEDPTVWLDDDGRKWKLNAEFNASYHQPYHLYIAAIISTIGPYIPIITLQVPNLKFISPNKDGRYSEICANRYTGELIVDQLTMGTFNYATDAPDAMVDGALPTTGEHDKWDVITHKAYGHNYQHIVKGIKIGPTKGPVVLGHLEKRGLLTWG